MTNQIDIPKKRQDIQKQTTIQQNYKKNTAKLKNNRQKQKLQYEKYPKQFMNNTAQKPHN